MPKNMKAFYFSFVALIGVVNSQYKGDPCTDGEGSPGTCKKILECPAAIQAIQTGVLPQRCSFDGSVPIICCKNPKTSLPDPTPRPPVLTSRKAGEMSRKKCKEYAKYVYEKTDAVVPIIGAQPMTTYECGITAVPLIVGGEKAGFKEFPHMALIGYPDGNEISYRCGGSIISEHYILTAAHCIEDAELGAASAAAIGMLNINDRSRQVVKIVETIYHPGYEPPSHYNDIGLLKFEGAKINSYARPACLYSYFRINHQNALASGWGRLGYTEDTSKDLLKVKLELFGVTKCNFTYRHDYGSKRLIRGILDDTQLCAGSTKELKDTCQGDSGGPLQIFHDGTDAKCMYDLVGITSFGKACGLVKNSPGVYTRISAYIKWIEDIVWPN
ncbi:unnamed protein product [Brassicogethes aeneus]|uniref:Uncharacterized protein n=1 Tax=Brassicogethes aeneus TaxID=1431903 RepID=A0A9P0FKP7_BRAAE|nr:unnamed protein product [Brassicogethes aeneus]